MIAKPLPVRDARDKFKSTSLPDADIRNEQLHERTGCPLTHVIVKGNVSLHRNSIRLPASHPGRAWNKSWPPNCQRSHCHRAHDRHGMTTEHRIRGAPAHARVPHPPAFLAGLVAHLWGLRLQRCRTEPRNRPARPPRWTQPLALPTPAGRSMSHRNHTSFPPGVRLGAPRRSVRHPPADTRRVPFRHRKETPMQPRHSHRTPTTIRRPYWQHASRRQRHLRVAALRHWTRHYHQRGGRRVVAGASRPWYWRNFAA